MIHETQKSGLELDKTWLSPSFSQAFPASQVFTAQSQTEEEKVKNHRKSFSEWRKELLLLFHAWLYDRRFERLLFISSQGQRREISLDMNSAKTPSAQSDAVPVKVVEWSLRALPPHPHGMYFVDFETGLGQRALIASTMEFERIICSETSEELYDNARMNIAQFPRPYMSCRSIDLVCAPSLKLAIPEKSAAFMFFKPKGLADLRLQIDRIISAYRAAPRRFYILTIDADAPQHDLILSSGVFQVHKYSQFQRLKQGFFSPYKIRAYRTIV